MKRIQHLRAATFAIIVIISTSSCTTVPRDPPMLQTEAGYTPPTQEQKLWALATCAILTASNQERHDLLGGCERTPTEIKVWQAVLSKWWDVNNREDLLRSLTWIEEGGHRQDFDQMARDLSTATPARLASIRAQFAANPSVSNKIEVVLKYKDDFGRKSLMAWDYNRYVALCGWGYVAGYFTEEEAWQRIMPTARLLQKTFDSWEELGRNHVVGREFWSWKHTQKSGVLTRQCYENLLTDPSSPWVRLKWDTELLPPTEKKRRTRLMQR